MSCFNLSLTTLICPKQVATILSLQQSLFSQIYDPKHDIWTQSVDLSGYRMGFCAAVSESEDELYIVGGIDENGNYAHMLQ